MVRRDPLKTANGDGFIRDADTPASGLTRTVANATEDSGEHVRLAIHHVGLGELALRNQPNVFGNIGMCRARPLAVHDTMEILLIRGIRRFHFSLCSPLSPRELYRQKPV